MEPFHQYLPQYREQLQKGAIKEAYKGLMQYLDNLRLHLEKTYPDYFVSGSVNHGLMDYSYFYFFPKSIKQRKLKVVLLFVHDGFRFEVWLAGYNRSVQTKYWKRFKENNWNKYPLAATTKNVDYIMSTILIDKPDFTDLAALTDQIEKGLLAFIGAIEDFLSNL